MKSVYAIASHAVSAMGMDIAAHWRGVLAGAPGIARYEDTSLSPAPFMASRLDAGQWQMIHEQTRGPVSLTPFEQLAAFSVLRAIDELEEPIDLGQTAFILSTTKGNIELLGQADDERILLHTSADYIAGRCRIPTPPTVISHACASGVIALQYAARLLHSGRYRHAIVTGCDRFSRFILSGFQSFQAISDEPCRPFDKDRKGITLGEAASTIILSANKKERPLAKLGGGSSSNDANHISGPSRTGAELAMAVDRAMKEAEVTAADISMISAHGTATLYNDEMEAKAFDLCGLGNVPLYSFKGYVGHTLGAAGVLESALSIKSIREQVLIPSAGFSEIGVSIPLNVTATPAATVINNVLKTASGFGGCNAAVIWSRV